MRLSHNQASSKRNFVSSFRCKLSHESVANCTFKLTNKILALTSLSKFLCSRKAKRVKFFFHLFLSHLSYERVIYGTTEHVH